MQLQSDMSDEVAINLACSVYATEFNGEELSIFQEQAWSTATLARRIVHVVSEKLLSLPRLQASRIARVLTLVPSSRQSFIFQLQLNEKYDLITYSRLGSEFDSLEGWYLSINGR